MVTTDLSAQLTPSAEGPKATSTPAGRRNDVDDSAAKPSLDKVADTASVEAQLAAVQAAAPQAAESSPVLAAHPVPAHETESREKPSSAAANDSLPPPAEPEPAPAPVCEEKALSAAAEDSPPLPGEAEAAAETVEGSGDAKVAKVMSAPECGSNS